MNKPQSLKDTFLTSMGTIGMLFYACICFLVAFAPLYVLDAPLWLLICVSILVFGLGLSAIWQYIAAPLWIWAFVVAINGPQDIITTIYYVLFALYAFSLLANLVSRIAFFIQSRRTEHENEYKIKSMRKPMHWVWAEIICRFASGLLKSVPGNIADQIYMNQILAASSMYETAVLFSSYIESFCIFANVLSTMYLLLWFLLTAKRYASYRYWNAFSILKLVISPIYLYVQLSQVISQCNYLTESLSTPLYSKISFITTLFIAVKFIVWIIVYYHNRDTSKSIRKMIEDEKNERDKKKLHLSSNPNFSDLNEPQKPVTVNSDSSYPLSSESTSEPNSECSSSVESSHSNMEIDSDPQTSFASIKEDAPPKSTLPLSVFLGICPFCGFDHKRYKNINVCSRCGAKFAENPKDSDDDLFLDDSHF